MQIVVRSAPLDPPYAFNQAALEQEFTTPAPAGALGEGLTLFERAQDPIIVGQTAYSTAYPGSYFPPNWPWSGIRSSMQEHSLQFVSVAGDPIVVPMEPKGIHDEMGASFDPEYGRMSGNLAMEIPNPTTNNANLLLYGYSDLPSETIANSTGMSITVVPGTQTAADGTQIWNISHNGVDTHPIHFHIFDVQLINRIGWDGQLALPEPQELGWKDTVRISPLMDTIVAVRPRAPLLPFGIPDSLRPLNPAIPIGSGMGFNSIDWTTGEAYPTPVTNVLYNFNWEYVWHCHILSHEEMDMMRSVRVVVASDVPGAPTGLNATAGPAQVDLTWTDASPVDYVTRVGFGNPASEIGFRIERRNSPTGTFAAIATALANATAYADTTATPGNYYEYRVVAFNVAGEAVSTTATVGTVPATNAFIGTFRASAGRFYLDFNGNGAYEAGIDKLYTFGQTGDLPVVGDWNGDGKNEIGIFRPSTGRFYLDFNGNGVYETGTDRLYTFGLNGDRPVAGDWNGDGTDEIGIFRPGTGRFYLDFDGNGTYQSASDRLYIFGTSGDLPVAGDWNGDGTAEIGVFRPSTARFYLDTNANGAWNAGIDTLYTYGATSDLPVAGDWDGDGATEIGTFRPSTARFYLDTDGSGTYQAGVDASYTFGLNGDRPVAGVW
jgi:hypothetical protein